MPGSNVSVEKQLEIERRLTQLEGTDKHILQMVGVVAEDLTQLKKDFDEYKEKRKEEWDKFTDSVTKTLNGITNKLAYAAGALLIIGGIVYFAKDVLLKWLLG